MNFGLAQIDLALFRVQTQLVRLIDGIRLCAGLLVHVPQGDADARQQLACGEGLGQVVVRAEIEHRHLFLVLIARGDDDHRHFRPRPQAADDLRAVEVGQAQIQQHQVDGLCGQQAHGLLRRRRRAADVGFRFQRKADEIANLCVILDHEDMLMQTVHCTSSSIGSSKVKTAPPPSRLCAMMLPPCALAIASQMDSPSPTPRAASALFPRVV